VPREPSESNDSQSADERSAGATRRKPPLPTILGHVDHGKSTLTERIAEHLARSGRPIELTPIAEQKVTSMNRRANVERITSETSIKLELALDGSGNVDINTGVGFFDHMLTHLGKHSLFDLTVRATGDTHIDDHHTVEDVGLAFGSALAEALDDKAGIQRYGSCTLPMDETLVTVALDLSGRPCTVWNVAFPTEKIGAFDCQLAEEFWRAVANSAKLTLHVMLHHGSNSHHIAEATFKAAARALRDATAINERLAGEVPSTKGVL